MKILGVAGMSTGILALILGCYLQFVLVPAADEAEMAIELSRDMYGSDYYDSAQYSANLQAKYVTTDFGVIVMGAGLLAFLLSIVPAIKKIKIAWIGVVLGILTFFIGAAHGTHMFS